MLALGRSLRDGAQTMRALDPLVWPGEDQNPANEADERTEDTTVNGATAGGADKRTDQTTNTAPEQN